MALGNFVRNIRNIMRQDAGINGDAQRIEQLSWMLFLKIYDSKEMDWEMLEGDDYHSIIPPACRWRSWAHDPDGKGLTADALLDFVNNRLFPTLKQLPVSGKTPMRQAIVQTTFRDANQYMKDGVLLRQLVNVIDALDLSDAQESHAFGEIYETILRELQSAGSAGEFYTPRALTDLMAILIDPQVGERMADFACGTGGFLSSWLSILRGQSTRVEDEDALQRSIYGVEKKQFPYMLCVTNMLLHELKSPEVYHGNSLTRNVLDYTESERFDVILMNPPYGGSETEEVKQHFPKDLTSSETADLFMILIMYRLKKGGRAAVILPDGFLFGVEGSKYAIKEKLLRDFNLHTVIRLPKSVFSPYTGISTNILFFDHKRAEGAPEGYATAGTWFYRLDMPEGYKAFSKTKPMTLEHCRPIRDWWSGRHEIVAEEGRDEQSRYIPIEELVSLRLNLDQCRYPSEEQVVLPPDELLTCYYRKRRKLEEEVDRTLAEISRMMGIDLSAHGE